MLRIYYHETKSGLIQPELFQRLDSISEARFVPAPRSVGSALDDWDGAIDFRAAINEKFLLSQADRLLITCEPGSQLQGWCVLDLPHAKWGWSDGDFSVIYTDQSTRLATQLHEFLHFLGVDDCYDAENPLHPPKSSCSRKDCVMLYGVNSLEFCDSVKAQIDEFNKRAQCEHI